jgi:hypothetical protein
LIVDFVVCTLAVQKKKSGQVSTSRIGPFPCDIENVVMRFAGLRPGNDCAGEAQEQLLTTDLSCRCIRAITASVQLKNKNSGFESQGSFCHDELIGGEPPVAKYL